jgi:hypothetical protein
MQQRMQQHGVAGGGNGNARVVCSGVQVFVADYALYVYVCARA